jgi:surface-anchored protein
MESSEGNALPVPERASDGGSFAVLNGTETTALATSVQESRTHAGATQSPNTPTPPNGSAAPTPETLLPPSTDNSLDAGTPSHTPATVPDSTAVAGSGTDAATPSLTAMSSSAPSSGPSAPAPCAYHYRTGHGDLYLNFEGGKLQLRLRSAFSTGTAEQLYAPEIVCIHVPRSTYLDAVAFGGRPAGEAWSFVGVPSGEAFWFLPQVARSDAPWFGLASADWRSATSDPARVAFQVLEGPSGANIAAWLSDAFGSPLPKLSSATGELAFALEPAAHIHLNWSFTRAGIYMIQVNAALPGSASAPSPSDGSVTAQYRFEVEP